MLYWFAQQEQSQFPNECPRCTWMRDHALKQAEEASAEAKTHSNRFFASLSLQIQARAKLQSMEEARSKHLVKLESAAKLCQALPGPGPSPAVRGGLADPRGLAQRLLVFAKTCLMQAGSGQAIAGADVGHGRSVLLSSWPSYAARKRGLHFTQRRERRCTEELVSSWP